MKKIIGIAIVLMMIAGLMIPVFASASSPAPQDIMWVNCPDGKRLNVRETPSTKARLLYRVECGKPVEVLSNVDGVWYHVRQEGKADGYVMAKYLVSSKPGKYEITERSDNFRNVTPYLVTARALNAKTENSVGLRVKPNKTAQAIRRLTAGDELKVIAVGNTWSRVIDLATGKTGYVANDYIERL